MKNKDFLYHCIDWALAILLATFQISKNNYIVTAIIFISALSISLFLVCQKNKKLKHDIDVYETLLKYPIPLYGVVNYLFKKKSTSVNYKNSDIHLHEISLNVKIVGNISDNANNDLEYTWTFIGKNTSQKDIGKFYLHIGGDSATPFENLKLKCVDCGNAQKCKFSDSLHKCHILNTCEKRYSSYYIKNDNLSSKTLYLLDINFIEKIKPHSDLSLKISYVWPQCYNCNYDFILIDPSNFAPNIETIRLVVTIDNIVIKSISRVQLFSMDKNSNVIENEGQFQLLQNKSAFVRRFNADINKIYFATIENMKVPIEL